MGILYPELGVVPGPVACGSATRSVSDGASSLYRWLHRWYGQTGDLHPSTRYLARKQGKTERTIYRWLAELRGAGWLSSEVSPGVERRIVPLSTPLVPIKRKTGVTGAKTANLCEPVGVCVSGVMSGVMSGVVSGVPPYTTDAHTQKTTTTKQVAAPPPSIGRPAACQQVAAPPPPEVVSLLCSVGVCASTAVRLVVEHGERRCREQLEALPFRVAGDRAAVLVASIREKWGIPSTLVAHRDKVRKEEERASKERAKAIVDAYRAKTRENLLNRLSGLPTGQKVALEQEAIAWLEHDRGPSLRLIRDRAGWGPLVRETMLRLLSEREGLLT